MGKKSKRNRSKASNEPSRLPPSFRTEEEETFENLRFQDPFADEEIAEEVVDERSGEDDGWEDADDDEAVIQSWNPLTGEPLAAGEKLEMDPTAYKM